MTRDEILDVAEKFYKSETITEREVAFARFVMKHERNECAKTCEKIANLSSDHTYPKALECADAIRNRGNNT
jgi:hypothetical protein